MDRWKEGIVARLQIVLYKLFDQTKYCIYTMVFPRLKNIGDIFGSDLSHLSERETEVRINEGELACIDASVLNCSDLEEGNLTE